MRQYLEYRFPIVAGSNDPVAVIAIAVLAVSLALYAV